MKCPKNNVPTIDGNIMNWNGFWQQFSVAVNNKNRLKDTKKLVYLIDTFKNEPVKHLSEGLTQDAEYYKDAIDCPGKCYEWQCIIHQDDIHTILDASLKDSHGKELCHLYYVANQRLCAFKLMKNESFASFITSILDTNLDQATMFGWQRHTQGYKRSNVKCEIVGAPQFTS